MAFCCDGTLDLSGGGTIDATGAGVQGIGGQAAGAYGLASASTHGNGGSSLGASGTNGYGSALGNWFTGNSGVGFNNSGTKVYSGGNGGCGDAAIEGVGPLYGVRTDNFPPCSLDRAHNIFYIYPANAGYSGRTGESAGAGGAGGGGGAAGFYNGGGGTSSQKPEDGYQGFDPSGLPSGGVGGIGGNGGGFVYINAYHIKGTGNNSDKLIISKGTVGQAGEEKDFFHNYGKGGNGENGGHGAQEGCVSGTFYAPGGGGGPGLAGNGPDGGDGGNGGDAGIIWLQYNYTTSFSAGTGANLDVSLVAGGNGGLGGDKGNSGNYGADGIYSGICAPFSCGTLIGGPGLTYTETVHGGSAVQCKAQLCDCDNAWKILSYMSHTVSLGSGVYRYDTPVGGSGADARDYCIKDNSGITSYKYTITAAGTCTTPGTATLSVYRCDFHNAGINSSNIWTNIAPPSGTWNNTYKTATWTNYVYSSNQLVDHGTTTFDMGCSSFDGWTNVLGEYNCDRPRDGLTGLNGADGAVGDATPESGIPTYDPSWASGEDPTKPVVVANINTENNSGFGNYDMHIQPNPASQYITLNFKTNKEGIYKIRIMDISGKTLYTKSISSTGENQSATIDLKEIPLGQYVISLSNNNTEQRLKFIKN